MKEEDGSKNKEEREGRRKKTEDESKTPQAEEERRQEKAGSVKSPRSTIAVTSVIRNGDCISNCRRIWKQIASMMLRTLPDSCFL